MDLKDTLHLGCAAYKTIFLRRRIPLIAGWRITNRCNYSCRYCDYWKIRQSAYELNTKEVFKVIDQLVSKGMRRIGFTGGEPLIRDDFGEIIEYCADRGIKVGVNTNGSLIRKHITRLDRLKRLSLSIDGPKDINDSIRGKGSFDHVMDAVTIARERNIENIELVAVLSNANVNSIGYLLDLAAGLKIKIIFQPATHIILGGDKENSLALSETMLKKRISILREAKRFNKYIANSSAGLKYLSKYPKYKTVTRCAQGVVAVRLDVDSRLYICDRCSGPLKDRKYSRVIDVGFDKAWANIRPLVCKTGCGCAKVVELNLALAGNVDAILNSISLY